MMYFLSFEKISEVQEIFPYPILYYDINNTSVKCSLDPVVYDFGIITPEITYLHSLKMSIFSFIKEKIQMEILDVDPTEKSFSFKRFSKRIVSIFNLISLRFKMKKQNIFLNLT